MGKNIAILASGNGTNAENIIRYFKGHATAEVKLVISNRSRAFVLERAENLGVTARYFPKEDWATGEAVLQLLRAYEIDFVVLAGFLARVPDGLIQAFPNRIVNIHPSLLPKFGGKGMFGNRVHEAVVAAGERESGITIHYINEHYDEGAVIVQFRCPVFPSDSSQDVACRVHALEYRYFPRVIERLLQEMDEK